MKTFEEISKFLTQFKEGVKTNESEKYICQICFHFETDLTILTV